MGYKFWTLRALSVFFCGFIALFIVQLLKQHSFEDFVLFMEGTTWSTYVNGTFILFTESVTSSTVTNFFKNLPATVTNLLL